MRSRLYDRIEIESLISLRAHAISGSYANNS